MRFLIAVAFALVIPFAQAELAPERIGTSTLGEPGDHWFVVRSNGGYLFDADTGNMLGMLALTTNTAAIAISRDRAEVYAPEGHWTRTYRGDREDVLTIYDANTLRVVGEIDIPDKTAALSFEEHVGLTGNQRFVLVYNLTPAQSVSVVDVEKRVFTSEVSTPGCGMIMPVGEQSFLSVCGDGTVQLIVLDDSGQEAHRERSEPFFNLHEDAVFDRATRVGDSWLLISHSGQAFNVSESRGSIRPVVAWSLLSDEDRAAGWRPGGTQLVGSHIDTGIAYVLMHRGGVDTHHDAGEEVWVLDTNSKSRIARWPLEHAASHLLVTQGEQPKLILVAEEGGIRIYDGRHKTYQRRIEEYGPSLYLLQPF